MGAAPHRNQRIMVVEDEYYFAMDLEANLAAAGATVIDPFPSIGESLAAIAARPRLDAAVLDINLRGIFGYPVADALVGRAIPFMFAAGYFDGYLDRRYPAVPRCDKPIEFRILLRTLVGLCHP